jgi:hypothetical protein
MMRNETCEHYWLEWEDDAPYTCKHCEAPGDDCPRCCGDGWDDDPDPKCPECGGHGIVATGRGTPPRRILPSGEA